MLNQITTICTTLDDATEHEELLAFAEAIQDPDIRQKIITILEEAELLP